MSQDPQLSAPISSLPTASSSTAKPDRYSAYLDKVASASPAWKRYVESAKEAYPTRIEQAYHHVSKGVERSKARRERKSQKQREADKENGERARSAPRPMLMLSGSTSKERKSRKGLHRHRAGIENEPHSASSAPQASQKKHRTQPQPHHQTSGGPPATTKNKHRPIHGNDVLSPLKQRALSENDLAGEESAKMRTASWVEESNSLIYSMQAMQCEDQKGEEEVGRATLAKEGSGMSILQGEMQSMSFEPAYA